MGFGGWDARKYDDRVAAAAAAGRPTFDHTAHIRSGRRAAAVHSLLDPKRVATSASPFAGRVMREVCISDEHPRPTVVTVVLDETGSNIDAARVVHSKLPELFGVLQRWGISDPQLNCSAIGDANGDLVPLQMGDWESDTDKIAAQLEAIYLESAGGGQDHETYELAAYFLARHSHLAPLLTQKRRGFAIFIGDEKPYGMVSSGHVRRLIGDELDEDISTKEIFRELQRQFHVFYLFQARGSYHEEQILPTWRELLGERALVLDDPAAVCETIAGIVGMLDIGLRVDRISTDLRAHGASDSEVDAATRALVCLQDSLPSTAQSQGGTLPVDTRGTGSTRL